MPHDELTSQGLHPAVQNVFRFFTYEHLPPGLQAASRPFHDLAREITTQTTGPETVIALRKLLESKDAAVRAHLHERIEGPTSKAP